MIRYILFSILGAITALVVGMVIGIGQYIGMGNGGIILVIVVGAIAGTIIAYLINNRSNT